MLLATVETIGRGVVENKARRTDQVTHIRIVDGTIVHETLVEAAISGYHARFVKIQNRLDMLTQEIR